MKSIAILICLALAACATEPRVIYEPQEVKVIVPVPCSIPEVQEPAWLLDNADIAKKSFYEKGILALRELEQRRAYEEELKAAIKACTPQQ